MNRLQHWWESMPPVTKNLLVINIIVFVAMQITKICGPLERYCAMYYIESDAFHVWQPFTYMFIHVDFLHLFFNMFALFMFGGIIEWTMGSRRFFFYYITCGLGAALVQQTVFGVMIHQAAAGIDPAQLQQFFTEGWKYWQMSLVPNDPALREIAILSFTATIGASGAVYGILLAFGMLYPNQKIYIFPIPFGIKAKWLIVAYFVIELVLGVYNSQADNIAHFAHLGGMIFGALLILYWKHRGDLRTMY